MLGPNSLPFVYSLADPSWYFPSNWTHSNPRIRLSECDLRTAIEYPPRGWRQVSCSGDNEKNVYPGHEAIGIQHEKRPLKSPLVDRPSLLSISRSLIPRLALRFRHTSLTSLHAPSSPCLPTVSPDAQLSRRSQSSSQPYADFAKHKFLNTQEFWLTLYFAFNLSLTLCNKGMLVKFPYPYTLTALHALCGAIGGWSLQAHAVFVPKQLKPGDYMALLMFSVLYAMNIAVSNASLNLVTVPVHQVVRATTPIFTLVLSSAMFGTRFSPHKLMSLIPVMVGVGLATYGDYSATTWGLFLTLFGTFLAALKTIFTNVLQSNPTRISPHSFFLPPALSLHPLDLLTRMCPLAFIQCVLYAQLSGELDQVRRWSWHEMSWLNLVGLFVNGCIAFGLNVVSFTANKKAGPLSMTVAANIKQVLTILLAVLLFDLNITLTNGAGIIFTLAGGAWYGYVDYNEKRRRRGRERTMRT